MGYFSASYLTYTAEDARMDKADGLPALVFPKAPVQAARKGKYQVGSAQMPIASDPWFDDERAALAEAEYHGSGDTVYAVWTWDDRGVAEAIYLVYQSVTFKPA